MRELKFRAWYAPEKEYIYDVQATYDNACEGKGSVYHENFREVLEDNECTVEQYTDLKDKNGKEIYEGDILGGIWESCHIAYCDRCKQFQAFTNYGCMACNHDVQWYELVEDDGKLEVIGNIHENSELLEGNE